MVRWWKISTGRFPRREVKRKEDDLSFSKSTPDSSTPTQNQLRPSFDPARGTINYSLHTVLQTTGLVQTVSGRPLANARRSGSIRDLCRVVGPEVPYACGRRGPERVAPSLFARNIGIAEAFHLRRVRFTNFTVGSDRAIQVCDNVTWTSFGFLSSCHPGRLQTPGTC